MNLRIFTVIFTLLITQSAISQQKFLEAVEKLLDKQEYRNALTGISVLDINTGETVFNLNSEKLLIPASNLKLVTSAAALEILGSDYRFQTKIGYTGRIENEILNGNLVVIGGGDPALGSEYFREHYFNPVFLKVWSEKIRNAGIKEVRGDLILDISLYDTEKIPPTWIWEDIGNYYGAGASALSVYDNLFRITFRSPRKAGSQTEIIAVYPKIEGLEIKNEVLSSDDRGDLAFVFGSPFGKEKVIRGTIPKNRRAFTIRAAMPQPEMLLANEFCKSLADDGVFISGKTNFENTPTINFHELYIQESPSLKEIIKVLNHESVNLFAEHLVKQIAAEKSGIGNREEGIKIIKEFWKERGVKTENLFMEDGSGLSHFNAISPKFFTDLLKYMAAESSEKETFINSLPTAGNGTLNNFDKKMFPQNTLMLKSGSMKRVRCYAGYLKANSGKNFAISVMFNQFGGTHFELIQEIENLLYQLKSTY